MNTLLKIIEVLTDITLIVILLIILATVLIAVGLIGWAIYHGPYPQ